ncbi:MAG: hypothetical protein ACYCZ8_17545, partial [Acidimicrobiales bacterium]
MGRRSAIEQTSSDGRIRLERRDRAARRVHTSAPSAARAAGTRSVEPLRAAAARATAAQPRPRV